ncbi:cell division protein DamX [Alteromonas sp. BL110]|uniref:SPOR domain-containing protein n=1 Tax=Alteromonas sp. BL110 TaxID=1714845 RepID=UPI000E501C15|nr:cell division protein DamX [Alteromonas sp. BL110]AXT38184.1 cell division protein DamX [Alteromonas sp. BL110]RKM80928.1 cell division protein DamX [Alteromonas sp. BL110]
MQSELHERLEYLVNYSSQLIFVSGESIAQQQKTLEAFVFQQHDDTEIAYLTAQDNMEPSDYRRQLCRQLLGQVVGSFVRPLNELLSDLNSHEGPILIAITQAHNLPDALLQELWDLVLQSRFAGNKQHLNVLLFANNAWAERAKQWLPAKNTETPLIISSQSVISEQRNYESDLDKMIASRREAFQAHLENRQRENTKTFTNPLKTKWFYACVALVFLATFCGLIYWQYGEKLASIFSPISRQTLEANDTQVEPGSAYDKLIAGGEDEEGRNVAVEKIEEDTTDGMQGRVNTQTGNVEIVSTPSATPVLTSQPTLDKPVENEIAENDSLITDWESAVSSLPNAGSSPEPESNNSNIIPSAQSGSSSSLDTSAGKTTDQRAADNTQTTLTSPQNTDTALGSETLNQPTVQLEQWISANDYAIQMLAMKSESVLNAFLRENNLVAQTRIYKTERYGGDWFVVVFREVYPSLSQAQQTRAALPEYPGKQNAFIKRGSQILAEIDKAQN